MTIPEFCLVEIETGKVLKQEPWDDSVLRFYNHWTKKFLRYQRTSQELKAVIKRDSDQDHTLLVGWSNFDQCRKEGMSHDEIIEVLSRFESYHKRYWPEN